MYLYLHTATAISHTVNVSRGTTPGNRYQNILKSYRIRLVWLWVFEKNPIRFACGFFNPVEIIAPHKFQQILANLCR